MVFACARGCDIGVFARNERRRRVAVVRWVWPGLVLWTGCFEGCWLLLVVLRPLARVLVG